LKNIFPLRFKRLVLPSKMKLPNMMKAIATSTCVMFAEVWKPQKFLSLVIEIAVKESTMFLVWVFPWNVSPQVYGGAVYALKTDFCLVYIQSVRELNLCGMSRRECRTANNIL
jgi:hypothetical protein